MRIVKQGNLLEKSSSKSREKKKRCPKCGSIIAYTEDDVYSIDDDYDNDFGFECPYCDNKIITKTNY
ncbi:MAG: hypothetical protein IJW82_04860 [Clostridia bacterium]|nr:hypothetical protein [Clostridia bacterium]